MVAIIITMITIMLSVIVIYSIVMPGVVKEVGGEVGGLKPGDRVWFVVPHCLQVLSYQLSPGAFSQILMKLSF